MTTQQLEPVANNLVGPVAGVEFGVIALTIPEGTEYDDWVSLGRSLMATGRSHAWWIGDWWTYGEHTYGERMAQLSEEDRTHFQTFMQMGWVARRIETSRRREVLTWSHHVEVARMEPADQDRWLDLAISQKWATRQLRSAIRKARHLEAEREATEQGRATGGTASVVEKDALAFLSEMRHETADLLLTDPPYMTDVPDIAAFARAWVPLALSRVKRTGRAYICTGPYPEELQAYLAVLLSQQHLKLGNVLVWTYRNTLGPAPEMAYKNNWQAVFYLYGPDALPLNAPLMTEQFSVQDISAPDGRQGDRYHTWQKPIELGKVFVRHATTPGAVVVDPFAGTGTFVLAAAQLGRFGLGSDTDREMLDICEQRGIDVRYAV